MISKLKLLVLLMSLAAPVAASGAKLTVGRDPFPNTIPEAFGINSHYWDFCKGDNFGRDAIFSMDKWHAWWGWIR